MIEVDLTPAVNASPALNRRGNERKLALALSLTVAILVIETLGAIFSHSLALFADAGHVVTDLGALALALFAARQAHRPADATRTYGYHRTGILVALANASSLIVIALLIVVEAVGRFEHPTPLHETPMILAALAGLSINLFIAARLDTHAHSHGHGGHDHGHAPVGAHVGHEHDGHDHDLGHEEAGSHVGGNDKSQENLNMRAARLHVLGDAGASAGVIVAAVVIGFTNWTALDPILSIAIAALISLGAWRLLGDAVAVLMEAVPREIDLDTLVGEMRRVPGVRDIHDLHVWSIGSGLTMLSCHARVEDGLLSDGLGVVVRLDTLVRDRFGIAHSTIQPETDACLAPALYCALPCGCCEPATATTHAEAPVGAAAAR